MLGNEGHDSQHKWNITRKVNAKVENGDIVFYYNKQPIGKMNLSGDGSCEFYDGYLMENDSIYSLNDFPDHRSYAENCDMGWC